MSPAILAIALITGPPALPPARAYSSIEVDIGQRVVLRPDFQRPEGHELISGGWRSSTGVDMVTFENDSVSCLWCVEAGEYRIDYQATFAKVVTAEIGGESVRVAVLPFVQHSQTWTVVFQARGPPVDPVDPVDPAEPVDPTKPRTAVIVYETGEGIPLQYEIARKRLVSEGHNLLLIDKDARTGTGTTPAFVSEAISKAKEIGVPALVVMIGGKVRSAIPLPRTAAGIFNETTR